MLIDSHCHLNRFNDNLDDVIIRAKEAGVKYILNICTNINELNSILLICKNYKNFTKGTIGIHPNEINNFKLISYNQLCALAEIHKKEIIGFGECGLDYYYNHSSHIDQKKILLEHIYAAQNIDLPIVIHTRNAEKDIIEIISSEIKKKSFKGVIHCFTGTKEFAYKILDLGFYISVSGIITFPKSQDLTQVISLLPINKLLIETDAPYLAPQPMRGKKNEPCFIKFTAQKLAELKNINLIDLEEIINKNFHDLFKV